MDLSNQVVKESIAKMKAGAIGLLQEALGTKTLEPFAIGGDGNVPYYWQDPNKQNSFNALTYKWYGQALSSDHGVISHATALFINSYIDVISKVGYDLSDADKDKLNKQQSRIVDQQTALNNAWIAVYGEVPPDQPKKFKKSLDIMFETIFTWCSKEDITLDDLQKAVNLNKTLDRVPPAAKSIVPAIASYLLALGSAVSILNETTRSNAYLNRVTAKFGGEVGDLTVKNGGMMSNEDVIVEKWNISPPLGDTVNSLKDSKSSFDMTFTISHTSEKESSVSVNGGASFSIPFFSFLEIGVGAEASYFSKTVTKSSSSVSITMSFKGVALQSIQPELYNMVTGNGWAWFEPIIRALHNKDGTTSGYRFSTDPQIDFSAAGPFGYLEAVAMCRYPEMTIVVTGSEAKSMEQKFNQKASLKLTFLGIPLGLKGDESTYNSTATTDATGQSVTIKLAEPLDVMNVNNTDRRAFILGVVPKWPVADQAFRAAAAEVASKKVAAAQSASTQSASTNGNHKRGVAHAHAHAEVISPWSKKVIANLQ